MLSLTTHDLIIPFDDSVNALCFQHEEDLKKECIAVAKEENEAKAIEQQAIEKDRFMFANEKTDTILCYTKSTGEWKNLQCYDTNYVSYTYFATCHIDSKHFQLSSDSTCQMLIPDPDPNVLKFAVEPRNPHPCKADWSHAILIALPEDSSVLICGLKWDASHLNPWRYKVPTNTWSYKLSE